MLGYHGDASKCMYSKTDKQVRGHCEDCNLWVDDDGEPYCAIKPLFTYCKGTQLCDEKTMYNEYSFVSKWQEEKKRK